MRRKTGPAVIDIPANIGNRQFNKEKEMEIYGLIIGLVIVVPLFARVWMADEPDTEEQAKTLLGALD